MWPWGSAKGTTALTQSLSTRYLGTANEQEDTAGKQEDQAPDRENQVLEKFAFDCWD